MRRVMAGTRWGKLTVIRPLELDKSGHRFVECRCDCGNHVKVRGSQLLCGDSKTCAKCPPSNRYEFKDGIIFGKCADGSVFLIDDADFYKVKNYQWCNGKGYMLTTENGRAIYLHKLILGLQNTKTLVDHINGNKSDNRRSNLREVTSAQNNQNQHCGARGFVGYRGVDIHTQNKNYRARIGFNGKRIYLGCFPTPKLAAQARNIASFLLHGEYAGLLNDVPAATNQLWNKVFVKCEPFLSEVGDFVALAP